MVARPIAMRSTDQQRIRGGAWMTIRERIMARDMGLCVRCRADGVATVAREIDHIVPLSAGGGNGDSNLQALCLMCHDSKSGAERR